MSASHDPIRRRFDPAIVLAGVIAIFSVLTMWHHSTACFGLDFYQFWVVGQEIQKPGTTDVYSDAWRADTGERYWQNARRQGASVHEVAASDIRHVLQTFSTPLLYTFFSVMGTHDYAQSLLHYQIISFACGIAALMIVCRLLSYSHTKTLLLIAAMFGWGESYLAEVFCGDVNQVQFFAIACLLWIEIRGGEKSTPARDFFAGALLAMIVLFKPNVAAIAGLLILMWTMQWRHSKVVRYGAAMGLMSTVIFILTSLRFGSSHCWLQWFGAVHDLEKSMLIPQGENYSLAAVVLARIGYSAARTASLLILLITFAIFAIRRAPVPSNPAGNSLQVVIAAALGAAVSLLSSPFAWLHYFVLAGPLLLLMLRPRGMNETDRWYWLRIGVGIVSLVLLCSSPVTNGLFRMSSFYASSLRMAGATTMMFAVVLAEYWRDSLPGWPGLSLGLLRRQSHATSSIR